MTFLEPIPLSPSICRNPSSISLRFSDLKHQKSHFPKLKQNTPPKPIKSAIENGTSNHQAAPVLDTTSTTITIKGILSLLLQNVNENDGRRLISLGMGDPTAFSCFHTTHVSQEAVVDALQSDKFNGYAPTVIERFKKYFDILGGPATFIQAAVPRILEETEEIFFKKTLYFLKQSSDICWDRINEIPCLTCPSKPEGSMAVMVKLDLSLLEDINDDIEFCFKLVKEESVIFLPGKAVGLNNWIRITFAADPSSVEEALRRTKSFCQRHARKLSLYDINAINKKC
ncbi:hypothetical protein DVH24_003091 [Malus domestica]|uniref:Aminotransferase class I/classII large domain-containing protein n=1 Tax=Malus domestica TaxID=3750 RepID=A0A498KBV1_MALDO|nr:hypothetical protein DVH24_003091 [Malus domestica]